MQSRPALLCIPGLLCDEQVWAPQVEALKHIADIDAADHGRCDSLRSMAQAALARMAAHPKFAVAGHSMGGRVALEILRLAPERVSRLALLDTGFEGLPVGEPGQQEIAKRRALLDLARTDGMRAAAMEWARGMVHPRRLQDARLMNAIYAMVERRTVQQFEAQIVALIGRPDAADVLAGIRCPTLVVCGEQDAWSPLAQHVELTSRITGSRLTTIADCGHMSTMEQPDAVANALRAWLTGVSE